jgi:DNA-binding transcriptional MerR regulator
MLPYDVRWTLDELCEEVAKALEGEGAETLDGRVREVPDRRTIRYYTTLGLLDRPAEMRGRTAYYGPRHLLQLLAIKRLQAMGKSLSAIQQALLGLDDGELRQLAGLPEQPAARRERSEGRREREAFWRTPPVPVESAQPANAESRSTVLQGVRLGPGTMLMIEATRPVREEDITALAQAAEPLLELLRTRGLL